MSASATDPVVKAAFYKNPLNVGDGACGPAVLEANLHRSNSVLFLWGIRLTVIPDLSPWQRWGREGGKDEQMGVTEVLILMQGPPLLSPLPLRRPALSCILSRYPSDVNPVQSHRSSQRLLCVSLSLLINISSQ